MKKMRRMTLAESVFASKQNKQIREALAEISRIRSKPADELARRDVALWVDAMAAYGYSRKQIRTDYARIFKTTDAAARSALRLAELTPCIREV